MVKEKTLTSITESEGNCNFDVNDIFYQRLLGDIERAISTLPEGAYSLELLSSTFEAIAAALAAFVINFFYWKRVDKKRIEAKRFRKILNVSEKLKKTASNYWACDYTAHVKQRCAIQEIDILDLHKKLVKLHRSYELEQKQDAVLQDFILEIYDVVTGGDFKSKARKSDMKRVKKIADLCTSFQLNFDSYI
ncbi:hypothetical protein [Pseudoalteromonas luteoviolacea]|uniref:hypothetical protein n=1 Tax=Pseudoalteromonas luteoviolacea TaxID=43657 RepID=UPI001152AC91|nr:hypothetical protein [Pseudoalteromonas luteoviolacea]TQF72569.1 hypothetical protein FLM44_16640 [Pseudoalteromonas luteoviolacea]